MNEKNDKLEYNVQQRARAGTAATFRGIVAAYIAYLGYRIIQGRTDETSTLHVWAHWAIGLAFIAVALGFGYYIWRRWRIDVEAARIREDSDEQEALPEEPAEPSDKE